MVGEVDGTGAEMPTESGPNLIRLFDFYLALMFLMSVLRRWDVYLDALLILIAVRGRWPKLIRRLAEHSSLLLNWSFFRPVVLALTLAVAQLVASRLIWPEAVITVSQLREQWWLDVILLLVAIPMLVVDSYFIIRVGRFDRDETVKYLDLAEKWLSWRGTAVKVLTLGIVDPTEMVDREVRKGLTQMRVVVTNSLWWVIVQTSLRITFGLTLWTFWAIRG